MLMEPGTWITCGCGRASGRAPRRGGQAARRRTTAGGIPLVACRALLALACLGLASCGGGPGGGRPDLVVADPAVNDATPSAGASLVFSATVHNAGERGAAATTLRVFRSDDATITTSDEQVGADTVAALAASARRGASVELRAPSSPGTSYYGACVDAVAGESDTSNNCSAAIEVTVPDPASAAPLPDLVVESPAVSSGTAAAGANFTFSATVRNAGDGDAAATTLVVYRSEDETITTSDQNVGEYMVTELAASATSAASVELNAPPGPGTYYYGACVLAVAEESDTANNCSAAVPVTVPQPSANTPQTPAPGSPRPDLKVEALLVSPASPAMGGTFRLQMTLRNAGRGRTVVGIWVRLYRSDDATFTASDPELFRFWRYALNAHSTEVVSTFVDTPSTKGEYYYRACAEAIPRESDTTNNCSVPVKIEVSHDKPDLHIYGTSAGGWDGGSFKLGASVRNLGGPSAATTLRFYQSPDDVITPSDVEVDSTAVPALVKEQSRTPPAFTSSLVTVPAPASPGTHYYGACVDALTRESDTTNNCSRAFYTVRK